MGQKRKGARAPKVAVRNKAIAKENIQTKIEYFQIQISKATSNGENGAKAVAVLPMSVRQFNNWELAIPADDPHATNYSFRRNAPQTLAAAPSSLATVRACVEATRQIRSRTKADGSSSQANKVVRLATLSRNLQAEKRLRDIAERELVAARERIETLKVEVKTLRSQEESKEREFVDAIAKANREIDRLKVEVKKRSVHLTSIDRRG